MGTPVSFRVKGGLSIDGKVTFKVFDSAPSGSVADGLSVGALGMAMDTGVWYRKTTIGAGTDKWSALQDSGSAPAGGSAVHWKHPVRVVETANNTLAQFVTQANTMGHLGGTKVFDSSPMDYTDKQMLLNASVLLADPSGSKEGRYLSGEGFASLELEAGSLYLVANTSGTAGNSITLTATINNPANATETTCVKTGTDFVVNLKNNGTVSTATVAEVVHAIEQADVDNLVQAVAEYTYSDFDTAFSGTFSAMAQTALSGGTTGAASAVAASGVIGTPNTDQLALTCRFNGTGWNGTTVTTTTNGLDGRTSTLVVYNWATNVLTINLKNDGVAVTETLDGLTTIMGSDFNAQYLDQNGLQFYDRPILGTISDASPGSALVPIFTGTPLSGGVDGDFAIAPLRGVDHPSIGWRPDEGDVVYVERGIEMGALYAYNDEGEWIKQGKADATETGFIRAYIGKTAQGNVVPSFTSTDIVTQGNNLTGAISELDAEAGSILTFLGKSEGDDTPNYASTDVVTADANVVVAIGELDAEAGSMLTFLGKTEGDDTPDYANTNIITADASLVTAMSELDAEAASVNTYLGKTEGDSTPEYTSQVVVTADGSIVAAISELDAEIGRMLAILGMSPGDSQLVYTSTRIVDQAENVENAISKLDAHLDAAKRESKSTAVTTVTTVDSIVMATELAAEWMIHAREVANPGNVCSCRVFASHNQDGVTTGANVADVAEYAILEMGNPITGFSVSVAHETAGDLSARLLKLQITSTDAVDVTLTREVLRAVA